MLRDRNVSTEAGQAQVVFERIARFNGVRVEVS